MAARSHLIDTMLPKQTTSTFLWTVLAMLPLSACATEYSAEPFSATVVDAESKLPLEGVVAVVSWKLEGGLEGGSSRGPLMLLEAFTDEHGRFNIPSWGPKRAPGVLFHPHLHSDQPEIYLFKSGYRFRGVSNVATGFEASPLIKNYWDGKTLELERFEGAPSAYAEHLSSLDDHLWRLTISSRAPCAWKDMPLMLGASMRQTTAFRDAGIKPSTFYAQLLANEDNLRDCGSVREFTEALK